jgi:hypothetical protein
VEWKERVSGLLVHAIGCELSRPAAARAWHLPPARGRTMLAAPDFVLVRTPVRIGTAAGLLGSRLGLYALAGLPLAHLGVWAETPRIPGLAGRVPAGQRRTGAHAGVRVLAGVLEHSG